MQHAVNPVAHAKRFGERFQVNVRRAGLESLDDQAVDQLDNRGVGFHHRLIVRLHRLLRQPHLHFALGDVLDHLRDGVLRRAVILVERVVNVLIRRHPQFNVGIEQPLQGIHHVQVRRVRQGDDDGVLVLGDWDGPIALGDVTRNGGNDIVGQAHFAQVDELATEVGRLGLGEIHRADDFLG